jgi:hypothetical protein
MKLILGSAITVLCLVLGCGATLAKGGSSLPKAWKIGTEADVPKGTATGGDACSKVMAVTHDLDQPFSDPAMRDKPMSGRDRMSGGGQYADPKELKNWVEFRLRETCGNKKLWGQIWAKTGLSKNYAFAYMRKCPGWVMKQNYLTPAAAGAPAGGGMSLNLDVYNYALAPKSIEIRLWDAKDFEGQAKGSATCPK